ncbi:MAG: hypothetical protein K9H49_20275 [Bacteroidales bacterium]|nr:hypothetical protein [Saprospiraceae bacterium]MCF8381916.1 hypothetical protein [Bacteroidales bacterium]
MKILVLFILLLPLCFYQCERKKDETYYLSENEKQFFPYKNGDTIRIFSADDSVVYIASGDSTYIVSDNSGLYGFSYEERKILLSNNEDSKKIYIRINKFSDPFCVYFDFLLDEHIKFELEPYDLQDPNGEKYITFIGDTTIYSHTYSGVYLLKSGGFSVGGVGLDSLYYNSQHGLINLKSDSKEYRFKY